MPWFCCTSAACVSTRLPRDRVLRHQRAVALQIDLGVVQRRLVLGELAFRLGQRDLIRARIDLGQEIALLDDLAFLERDLDQLAVDLRLDRDRRERRHRAERVQDDRHVGRFDRSRADRHRAGRIGAPGLRRRRTVGAPYEQPHHPAGQQHEQQQPQAAAPARGRVIAAPEFAARRCAASAARNHRPRRGPAPGPQTGRSDAHPFDARPNRRRTAAVCLPLIIARLYAGSHKNFPAHSRPPRSRARRRGARGARRSLECRDQKTLPTTRPNQPSFACRGEPSPVTSA